MREYLIPYLPEPGEKHPAPLRPSERKVGVYHLKRYPFDSEIKVREPGGSTYLMEYFECAGFIKALLQVSEVDTNNIMDRLWNFMEVYFHVDEPDHVNIRRENALERWGEQALV